MMKSVPEQKSMKQYHDFTLTIPFFGKLTIPTHTETSEQDTDN